MFPTRSRLDSTHLCFISLKKNYFLLCRSIRDSLWRPRFNINMTSGLLISHPDWDSAVVPPQIRGSIPSSYYKWWRCSLICCCAWKMHGQIGTLFPLKPWLGSSQSDLSLKSFTVWLQLEISRFAPSVWEEICRSVFAAAVFKLPDISE